MKKKLISGLLVLSMLCSMLVGCSTKQKENKDTTKQTEKTSQESSTEQSEKGISGELQLAIFQGGYGVDYWETMIQKFEEKYPNVTVKAEINPKIGEMIRPRIIAGDVPDLISLNYLGEPSGLITGLVKDKALLDLTDLFEEMALDKDIKLKDLILPGILESPAHSPYGDGKIYLAPFSTAPAGLIYNKTLFEEKGWENPTTWDEFFALNEEAKKDGRSLYTFPGLYPGYSNSMFLPALANHIGLDNLYKIFNYEPGSFSTPEVKEVLEQFARLGREGMLPGTVGMNHTQSQSEMMLGKSLFISNGTWIENEMKDAPREGDDAFAFAMNPSLKMEDGEMVNVMASTEQLSIPANAKNPEAAKEFIKFIYSDESVKLFGEKANGLIAVKGGVDLISEYITPSMCNMLLVLEQEDVNLFAQGYKAPPVNSKFNYMDVLFAKGLIPLYNGEITVDEYCEHVEKAFQEVQEEYSKAE
jgi:N-acetylglucosamine transport system substrate-binding protein